MHAARVSARSIELPARLAATQQLPRCLVVRNASRASRPPTMCWREACARAATTEAALRINHYGHSHDRVDYRLELTGEPVEDAHAKAFFCRLPSGGGSGEILELC
jgi:hypothetical protein